MTDTYMFLIRENDWDSDRYLPGGEPADDAEMTFAAAQGLPGRSRGAGRARRGRQRPAERQVRRHRHPRRGRSQGRGRRLHRQPVRRLQRADHRLLRRGGGGRGDGPQGRRSGARPAAPSSGARSSRPRDDPLASPAATMGSCGRPTRSSGPPGHASYVLWRRGRAASTTPRSTPPRRSPAPWTRDEVDDLAAWCVSVAKRAWIDDHRRREVFTRIAPELVTGEAMPATHGPSGRHARRARRPGRPALRRLRRGAGAGRPDGAGAARRLRADHRPDRDAPRHPGQRRRGPAHPGQAGAGAGTGRVPGPGPDRAEPPAPGRARLRGRHVHRRAPLRARAARCPRRHGATGAVDRRRARGDVPRRHRGPRAAGRRPARAGAPPGPRRRTASR